MSQLLLELLSEEIPARMQTKAVQTLGERICKGLQAQRLAYGAVQYFSAPRRIAVLIDALPAMQEDYHEERKGPRANAPEQAIDGFCRSCGVAREDLELRGDVYYANIHQKGRAGALVAEQVCAAALHDFPWPKSMRWGAGSVQWVRPLRSMVCLWDDAVIPLQFADVQAGRVSFGHRFHAPEAITLAHAGEYKAALEAAYVLVDAEQRKQLIHEQAQQLAAHHGLRLREDAGLLEEVTGLVEWPVVLMGQFEQRFLSLPHEVPVLEMKHHQRYFALQQADGALSQYFLITANIASTDGGQAIIHGNERVLRARLSDGEFFWKQDNAKTLEQWLLPLDGMIFHAKLGSMRQKVQRIESLAVWLAAYSSANAAHVARAAHLAKADLATGMVGEFPELQGIMGRYYAQQQGEDPAVADAIGEHYQPQGAEDDVPKTMTGAIIALADKLDTLVSLHIAGERATGSKDPYALRRNALGIVRIMLEHDLRIPLLAAVERAAEAVPGSQVQAMEIVQFIVERFCVNLRDSGLATELLQAALHPHASPQKAAAIDDLLVRVRGRAEALQHMLNTEDGSNLRAAFKRACNLLEKAEANEVFSPLEDASLLSDPAELALYTTLQTLQPVIIHHCQQEAFAEAMQALAQLRPPVDAFFDAVIVNAENTAIRTARLRLLALLRSVMQHVADFSKI